MAKMRTAHLLALAIDMPFMTENFLRFLCEHIEPGRGVLPTIENRAEPLAAVYPREAENDFCNALAGADFSLQSLVRRLIAGGKLRQVPITEQEQKFFLNVNEPADLASL